MEVVFVSRRSIRCGVISETLPRGYGRSDEVWYGNLNVMLRSGNPVRVRIIELIERTESPIGNLDHRLESVNRFT